MPRTLRIEAEIDETSYLFDSYRVSPEAKLWTQCLMAALEDAIKGDNLELWWIYTDEPDRVGSYAWICDRIGLDTCKIRSKLERNWKKLKAKTFRAQTRRLIRTW